MRVLQIVAVWAGCSFALPAAFAEPCRVLDPELAAHYVGGCRGGLADGYGTAKGGASFYQGEFKKGMKHGQGVKEWANGDRYEGGFKDDMRDGLGIYRWGDQSAWPGDVYSGEYSNDKPHGQGIYEWARGDRFEGVWKDGLRYGPSAMEVQRKRAQAALKEAVSKPGVVVCLHSSQGDDLRGTVRGRVERVSGDMLEVRIMTPRDPSPEKVNGMVKPDQIINSALIDWYPCS